MKTVSHLLSLLLTAGAVAQAAAKTDQVRLVQGGSESGELLSTSPNGVELEQRGKTLEISVVEIKSIRFDGEPPQLDQARLSYLAGGYETALGHLKAIAGQAGDDPIGQEIRYYSFLCQARLAIAGSGDPTKAYGRLFSFVRKYRDSIHFYEAVETLGDLKVAAGEFDKAEQMYAQIAKAPLQRLKLRGRLLASRVSQTRGDHAEAIRRFDTVARASGQTDEFADIERAAKLGKAVSLASSERLDDGLTLVKEVVKKLSEEDTIANAAAYNALGRCYEAAGQPTDALFAYLHTDLLFSDDPAKHAEALGRLVDLWKEAGKPDAAREALERLRREHAASKEARQAG